MRATRLAALAALAVGALISAGAAESSAPVGFATATASPAAAGARPAALTLKLHYEMTCGQPGSGSLIVTLPMAMQVPSSLARTTVLLAGKPATSVTVFGHAVTVGLPKPPKLSCMVIVPGTLTVAFTTAADLRNPVAAGAYRVHARIGSHAFSARLSIR